MAIHGQYTTYTIKSTIALSNIKLCSHFWQFTQSEHYTVHHGYSTIKLHHGPVHRLVNLTMTLETETTINSTYLYQISSHSFLLMDSNEMTYCLFRYYSGTIVFIKYDKPTLNTKILWIYWYFSLVPTVS